MLNAAAHNEPHVPQHVLLIFVATLMLAMVFPLVPLWGFGMRLAALLMIWHFRGQFRSTLGRLGTIFLASMLSLSAIITLQIGNVLTSRLSWILDRAIGIHGLQLPTDASLLVGVMDVGLVGGAAWVAWRFYRREGRVETWRRVAIVLAAGFAAWGLFANLSTFFTATGEEFTRNLNWLRLWSEWAICFLLAVCVVRREQQMLFLKTVVAAGALNAAIILGQHAVGDFSYVLESAQSFDDYFVRARANYYYHGAAVQFLLLPLFAVLVLNPKGRQGWWLWAAGLLIVAALSLNGTRATALATTVGMGLFLVLNIPWWRTPWRPTLFAVASIGLFGMMINYTKPNNFEILTQSAAANAATDPATTTTTTTTNSTNTASTGNTSANTIASKITSTRATSVAAPLMESNTGRIGLMISGIKQIRQIPPLGQGAGNINVAVGQSLGGTSTYSSHCLYVDSFLAGGFIAGVGLLLWFVVPLLFVVYESIFGSKSGRPGQSPAAAAGLFVAFGVSCMFFSIERADTIALFAAMLGLVFPRGRQADIPETQENCNAGDFLWDRRLVQAAVVLSFVALPFVLPHYSSVYVVVGLAVVMAVPFLLARAAVLFSRLPQRRTWQLITMTVIVAGPVGAAATSSCYAWPAIEFAWRNQRDTLWNAAGEKEVLTNSPGLAGTTRFVSTLLGNPNLKVRVLADDPSQLPVNATILWNPVKDHDYPRLIEHFGYLSNRPSGRVPGFRLPGNWSVVHSKQMTVSFLNVGPSVSPCIRPEDLGQVAINGRIVSNATGGRLEPESASVHFTFKPTHSFCLRDGRFSCQFETAAIGSRGKFYLHGEVVSHDGERHPIEAEGAVTGGWQQVFFPLPTVGIRSIEFTLATDESSEIRTLVPEIYCTVLPDIAAAAIDVRDGNDANAVAVTDDNLTTTHDIQLNSSGVVTFDFGKNPKVVSLYRLSRAATQGVDHRTTLSWNLQGSNDTETWHLLDSRRDIPIADEYKHYHSFTVAEPQKYRLYRIQFVAQPRQRPRVISLSEIELFPIPDAQDSQNRSRSERLADSRSKAKQSGGRQRR